MHSSSTNSDKSKEKNNHHHKDLHLVFKTIPDIFRFAPPIVAEFVSHQVSELLLLFEDDDEEEQTDHNSLPEPSDVLLHLSPKLKKWLRSSLSMHLLSLVDGPFQATKFLPGKSTVLSDQHVAERFDEKYSRRGTIASKSSSSPSQTPNRNNDQQQSHQQNEDEIMKMKMMSELSPSFHHPHYLKQQSTISSFNTCTAAFNTLADFYSTFESLMSYFANEIVLSDVFEKLLELEYEEAITSAIQDEEDERMMASEIKRLKLEEDKDRIDRAMSKISLDLLHQQQRKKMKENDENNSNHNISTSSSMSSMTIEQKLQLQLDEKRKRRAEEFSRRREEIEIEAAKVFSTGQLVVFCFVAFGKDLVDRIFASIDESSSVRGLDETLNKMKQQYELLIQQRDAAENYCCCCRSLSKQNDADDDNEIQGEIRKREEETCAKLLSSKYRWEYDVNAKKVVSSLMMKKMKNSSIDEQQQSSSLASLDKNRTMTNNKKTVMMNSNNKQNSSLEKNNKKPSEDDDNTIICAFCRMQKETVGRFYHLTHNHNVDVDKKVEK